MITATITGMHVRTKGRINPMEVHERIQLTTGINTCPVWGGGGQKSIRVEDKHNRGANPESYRRCA
jgi:hypothetical protein